MIPSFISNFIEILSTLVVTVSKDASSCAKHFNRATYSRVTSVNDGDEQPRKRFALHAWQKAKKSQKHSRASGKLEVNLGRYCSR